MAEIELGVWLFLNAVALGGFFAASRGWAIILIISIVIWTGLALYSWGGLNVVSTKEVSATTANRTSYDAPGGNITDYSEAIVGGYSEKSPVINSDFDTIGWTYMIGAMVAWVWLLKVIINTVQVRRGQIKASRYWSSQ